MTRRAQYAIIATLLAAIVAIPMLAQGPNRRRAAAARAACTHALEHATPVDSFLVYSVDPGCRP